LFSLVLGGAKSGKSNFALKLFNNLQGEGALVVTGKGLDFAFKKQILDHRLERNPEIKVFEVEKNLAGTLKSLPASLDKILIEGLDFWFFSLSKEEREEYLEAFWESLVFLKQEVILVSSEVGLGLLPGKLTWEVRGLGEFNQKLARLCAKVYLVVAGCALKIKDQEDGLF